MENKTVTNSERAAYKQQLLDIAHRLKANITGLAGEALRRAGGEASGGLSNAPMHPADLGTDNYEQEVALSLLDSEAQLLEDANAALRRVDEGTFGMCVLCAREVPRERLQALPSTRYCIDCARRLDADDG